MRRLLRIILWIVKGLTLLIALAALVMWPVSRGVRMGIKAERFAADAKSSEWMWYLVECWDRRIVLSRYWERASAGAPFLWFRREAQSGNAGWRFERQRVEERRWHDTEWRSQWGPIRWHIESYEIGEFTIGNSSGSVRTTSRSFAAPLWLVALIFGAWPALSLAALLKRWSRHRLAVRLRMCVHCGYDLCATPDRCPECGHAPGTMGENG